MPQDTRVTLTELDFPITPVNRTWAMGCMLATTATGTYRVMANLDGSVTLDNTHAGTSGYYPVTVRGVEIWTVGQQYTPGRGTDGFHDFRVDRRDGKPVTDAMRRTVREDVERVIQTFMASEHFEPKRRADALAHAEQRHEELSKLMDEATKAYLEAGRALEAARNGELHARTPSYRLHRF
jgi:hypothetical protein